MIINFLIDSRYGGPQMIHNHLRKIIKLKSKTIYLDKKKNDFNFINLKKINKILYILDVLINVCKLILVRKKFDHCKIFFVYSILNIVPVILGIILKKKVVWYILEKPDTLSYLTFKFINLFGHLEIICISDSLGKILKLKKYYIYFPTINKNYWTRIPLKRKYKNTLNIICVGNINKTKNHLQLIIFLEKLNINYQLIIVGKKLNNQIKYYNKISNFIKEINSKKKNKIKIYQNKKKEFIKKYLSVSDLYILPSLSEGLSVSLVEAMSMNLICFVSAPSNHSKIIKNNINGFEFDLNYNSFSGLISKIINMNQSKKEKIKNNAKKTANKLIKKNKIFEKKIIDMFFLNHLSS